MSIANHNLYLPNTEINIGFYCGETSLFIPQTSPFAQESDLKFLDTPKMVAIEAKTWTSDANLVINNSLEHCGPYIFIWQITKENDGSAALVIRENMPNGILFNIDNA